MKTLEDYSFYVYTINMKFYGELLIFVLLFITNARILFLKHAKRDPLVSLAPLSFLLSILFVFAWGLDFYTAAAVIIALVVLLSNFHALFRYSERLYVDHYSVLMKVWSFLTMILSGAAILGVIYFHPVELSNLDLGITETKTRMTGSFNSGFVDAELYTSSNADFYEFTLIPSVPTRNSVVLFVPDKRADTYNYKPFLQLLTKSGFTVFSGDFYCKDCRWTHSFTDSKITRRFALALKSCFDSENFESQREFYTYNISLELNEMYKFITEKYGDECKIYLITDSMGKTACDDFAKIHKNRIPSVFYLDSYSEYKTPGYGCIAQTDPLFTLFLEKNENNDMKSLRRLVDETSEDIKIKMGLVRK